MSRRSIVPRVVQRAAATEEGEAPVLVAPVLKRREKRAVVTEKDKIIAALSTILPQRDVDEELVDMLVIDDLPAIWEMASLSSREVDEYIRAIKEERRLREAPSLPYSSLEFLSPALTIERREEEKRETLLLRRDVFVEGAIECPKCHRFYVSTKNMQLRSADEPQTSIYTCGSCGNLWTDGR